MVATTYCKHLNKIREKSTLDGYSFFICTLSTINKELVKEIKYIKRLVKDINVWERGDEGMVLRKVNPRKIEINGIEYNNLITALISLNLDNTYTTADLESYADYKGLGLGELVGGIVEYGSIANYVDVMGLALDDVIPSLDQKNYCTLLSSIFTSYFPKRDKRGTAPTMDFESIRSMQEYLSTRFDKTLFETFLRPKSHRIVALLATSDNMGMCLNYADSENKYFYFQETAYESQKDFCHEWGISAVAFYHHLLQECDIEKAIERAQVVEETFVKQNLANYMEDYESALRGESDLFTQYDLLKSSDRVTHGYNTMRELSALGLDYLSAMVCMHFTWYSEAIDSVGVAVFRTQVLHKQILEHYGIHILELLVDYVKETGAYDTIYTHVCPHDLKRYLLKTYPELPLLSDKG